MGQFGLLIREIGNEDQRWIGNGGQADLVPLDIVLDRSLFGLTAVSANPRGFIKSGTPLGKVTATGLYGPYSGGVNRTEEVQTITEGGSGLTSFTLTFSGQTTGSIAAAASAATVQAALEALSNIAPGDVAVTGTGPYTVTFGGAYADTDVPQMTATPTGGTGTVTVATQTAGGAETSSDGREVLAGHLFASVDYDLRVTANANLPAALFWDGVVIENYLPSPVDANGKADVAAHITYITDNVGP